MEKWKPPIKTTSQEDLLLKRLAKKRKLFSFLRQQRHLLFDDAFQDELAGMYRQTGAGKPPVPPALMAMACLLQGYLGTSDADTVEMTVVDLRWQLVLDCLGAREALFSQGTFRAFRERLIAHDMDRRLLERSIALAREHDGFDPKKLPRSLRLAIDSSPLAGAGRVEDTINLIAHAARVVVHCIARVSDFSVEEICQRASTPLFLASSTKAGLDINWDKDEESAEAIPMLVKQVEALTAWIVGNLPQSVGVPPLAEHLETLQQLLEQDLEPDPSQGGKRICRNVAKERRVSIADAEMRNGRKSKSKAFNGYKRHVAKDLDSTLLLACSITPANRPESEAVPGIESDLERLDVSIDELYIDRGYIKTQLARDVFARTGNVISRPWADRPGLIPKSFFKINFRSKTITCPLGAKTHFNRFDQTVYMDAVDCDPCLLRKFCTSAKGGTGRSIYISEDERLQQHLRRLVKSRKGRQKLRERTAVEHSLAHVSQRQGNKARYIGCRRNLFDLRRVCSIQNLETTQRLWMENAA